MDFVSTLLAKLDSPKHSSSLNLLHLVVQNWIIFQRNTFDYTDENGNPFISQVFLIEISTGRYIHRSQGQQVDQGTSLDIDQLECKLTEVFCATKACQGFPIHDLAIVSRASKIVEYPYRRRVSKSCQFYLKSPHLKLEQGEGRDEEQLLACPSCLEAWQENVAKRAKFDQGTDMDYEPVPKHDVKLDDNEYDDQEASEDLMDYDPDTLDKFAEEEDEDEEDDWPLKPEPRRKKKKKSVTESPNRKASAAKMRAVEGGGKIYNCSHCSQTFSSRALIMRHQRELKWKRRNQRKVGCLECQDPEIVTFKRLGEHMAKMHPDKLKVYQKYIPTEKDNAVMKQPRKCSKCDLISNGSVMYFRHREIYHDLGDYRCQDCQEPCMTYYDLMIHNYQKHTKATEYIEPSSFGLETIVHDDGKIGYKKTQLMCQICLKLYKKECGLLVHMRTKHAWGMFDCKSCEESCHYSKDISAHMVQFHPDNPEIKCPNCLEVFQLKENPDNFNAHYQTCFPSTNQKGAYQCQYCGKEYTVKHTLDAHIKMHQGIILYKCSYCDYGSNHKAVLLDHEKMHLWRQGLTNSSSDLILTHQCDQCGKQFGSRSLINRHVRVVHDGIKPTFACKECGQFLKNSAALYKHRREKHGFVPKSKVVERI
ncbi:hypothetical protein TCAL_12905 [Tigriopus californicus]|uniref:C2H2-type domain-containing protein n=1 Tax=Tigriopus californicus TaxID=6832 RepID=A0A553NBA3_TIGCA|nr:zinc finger protein 723-like [Tigriopus californicus]TRY62713.1 hypothetical protein TCAL_12905 [Tigriopus californicus]|eukprot:TCALIF_12905-PA protein Name:"Similar to Zfp26 Zinc finger protein 26 (Mus musculus)" AED:0.58 eAED:0.58 QI:0/-1/0/1/-1/1/1/0/647